MADFITRFVAETQDYDRKVKSTIGLIEKMERELSDLSSQYNKLSQEERNSSFGQSLSRSISQLKTQIDNGKSSLADMEGQLSSLSRAASQLGGDLDLPMKSLAKLGPYGLAAAAAIKVATDALRQNDEVMSELGRTTRGVKAAYEGFLTSLNTGDLSGFLSRINQIVSAARDAYDALNELNTFNSFNQINIEKGRTGLQDAITDYREGKGSKQDVTAARNYLVRQLEIRRDLENEAYEKAINEMAQKPGVNASLLKKAFTGEYGDYRKLRETPLTATTTTKYSQGGIPYQETTYRADTEEQKIGQVLRQLTEDQLKKLQALGAQAQRTETEIARVDRQVSSVYTADKKQNERAAKEAAKPQERAQEKVTKALEDYANSMAVAKIRFDSGLDDEEKYKTNMLSAHQRLFNAYSEASILYEDPEYKTAIQNEVAEIKALSQAIKELKDEKEAQKAADRELRRAEREAAQRIRQIDTAILNGLTGTAKRAGWNSADLGVTGFKTKINAGIDITEEEWRAVQDRLNARLQSLGLKPIQINFETGAIEEIFDKIKQKNEEMLSSFSEGVGTISSLVGAMDNLKKIGDDLAEAFSGDMSTWDSMMTVLQSGISIMQTVISVIEAINTLTELSTSLKQANITATQTEAATTLTAAATEVSAETAKAGANMSTAGSAAAASSAEAGQAVAGIPIVGPILAVAAIAAVLAATFSAISKAKGVTKGFSTGGMVEGNSYSNDNIVARLNAGEGVLTAAGVSTAAQMAANASRSMGGMQIVGELSGETIRLALVNNNLRRGGRNGEYAIIG